MKGTKGVVLISLSAHAEEQQLWNENQVFEIRQYQLRKYH